MSTASSPTSTAPATADELGERVFTAALGMLDTLSIYVGDKLGWYRCLAEAGPMTADRLAAATGTHPRYVREWLEQQAVAGLLTAQDDPADPGVAAHDPEWDRGSSRRFSISPAAVEVFTDTTSLGYLAPLARMLAGVSVQLPALLGAYRSGGGVSWEQFGSEVREAQADINRPWFERELAGALFGVTDVHQALSADGARVADVGCGAGWSSIALARAYPQLRVDGIDIDEPSVTMARAHAETAGLADRVSFVAADAAHLEEGGYAVAFAFECLHDVPRPVELLAAVRRSLAPGGFLVVMDEAVAPQFEPDGDEVERVMYGYSLFLCLPDAMSSPPSAGTGTVMRESVLRSYAKQAGFTQVSVLPIEGFAFFRFYLLR